MRMEHVITFVTCIFAPVLAYSSGAPDTICHNNLIPEHHVEPQRSPTPYMFQSNDAVKAGDKLHIQLRGSRFLGFAVQARDKSGKPMGEFNIVESNKSQTLKCLNIADTLTHKKIPSDNPIDGVEFEWIAPKSYKGQIQFIATVARDGGTYWVRKTVKTVEVQ